jgi:hypothetical protein
MTRVQMRNEMVNGGRVTADCLPTVGGQPPGKGCLWFVRQLSTTMLFKITILLLYTYFATLHMTVERNYCYETVEQSAGRNTFLSRETLDFAKVANPTFADRPEWLRVATCMSAYGFLVGGAVTTVTILFEISMLVKLVVLYMGAKLYALLFYHGMEFLSVGATAPPREYLLHYWAAEGPYFVFIILVLFRLLRRDPFAREKAENPKAKRK